MAEPLGERSERAKVFYWLYIGNSTNSLATRMGDLAIPSAAILILDARAETLGILGAAESAAYLVFGILAGVIVDALDRRRVLVGAAFVQAVTLVLLAAITTNEWLSIPSLLSSGIVIAVAGLFIVVAVQAMMPAIAPGALLRKANAQMATAFSAGQIIGEPLSGSLLQGIGPAVTLCVTALISGVSAFGFALTARASKDRRRQDLSVRKLGGEILQGMLLVTQNAMLLRLTVAAAVSNLAYTIEFPVYLLFLYKVLLLTPVFAGIVAGVGAGGFLLGTIAAARMDARWGEHNVAIGSGLLVAGAFGAIPLAATLPAPALFLCAAIAIRSFGAAIFSIMTLTVRQQCVDDAAQGRVSAFSRVMVWGLVPVGNLFGGWAGQTIGIVPTLYSAAVVAIGAAAVLVQTTRSTNTDG